MSLYVLDTDHASLLQRGHQRVARQIAAMQEHAIAVTIVTAEEQLRGRLRVVRRAGAGSRLDAAYAGLRTTIEFFKTVELLDFDRSAADRYAELRSSRIRIGTQDLRIAAIVLSARGILVTRNQRDFDKVAGLPTEDWSRS